MSAFIKKRNNTVFNIHENSFFSTLIELMFFFIFYQQILVINIGGSFKIYELIALLFFCFYLFGKKSIYSKHSLILFGFFILSTSISFISYYLRLDAGNYYQQFPLARDDMRFNIYFIPILIMIYYFFNWVTINFIIGSRWVFENRFKLIKIYIYSGTIVSLYSIYGLIFVFYLGFPDLIPGFIDYRNSNPTFQIRPTGFSAEPSSYIVMQSWIILFLIYVPNLYQSRKKIILIIINGLVLILTLSSAIVALVGSIFIYYTFFKGYKNLFKFLVILSILILILYFTLDFYVDIEYVKYTFFEKIIELFTPPTTIISSGQFRSYTSWLGLEVFKDYPLFGVGGGNSYFYLYNYERNISIQTYGFELTHSVAPMNIYTKVLAELGIFGFIFLMAFILYTFYTFAKFHKENEFFKIGLIGTIMTCGFFFSVYPEYSLFLWINLALCLNILFHRKYL